MVLAVSKPQLEATIRTTTGSSTSWAATRPATWRSRVCAGRCGGDRLLAQPHGAWRSDASLHAPEAHRNLMLDQGARSLGARKQPVKLPLTPEEERAAA